MIGALVFQVFIEFGTCIFGPSIHNQGFNVYSPLVGQHGFIKLIFLEGVVFGFQNINY